MQTQTSNTLHNAIMEAGSKDRPPMLAPGNYVQWKSRIKRYTDTKPNHELIHYCLMNPPYKLGIDNDIYSTVDACPNACEMWKAIERLKQGESINVQDFKTDLYWEFGKFTSQDGESLESYYSRFYKMMNELIRNQCNLTNHQVNVQFLLQLQPEWQRAERIACVANPLALVAQQQPVYNPQKHPTHYTQNFSTRSQQAATRNKGKAIVNSPQPIYDQEPSMKPTNNNLRTSSNTSRANQDNSPRIIKSTRYENHRIGNVAGARETVGLTVVHKSGIQCYNYKEFGHIARECQKPKRVKDAAYHREKMLMSPESDDVIRLEKESRSKLSDLIRPFDYNKLNNLYDLFVPQRVIPTSSVSRPQLKSNPMGDKVMRNNSQGKKQEVEDQHRNVKLSKNKTSVTTCNDRLNAKTMNVNSVSAMCDKCVLNDKHDMCVLNSVEKPLKKTVALESNQKPRNITKKLYERIRKAYSWWYPKFTPSGYKWKPKSRKENVNPNVSMPLGSVSRTANILERMTSRCSTVSNTPLFSNSFTDHRDCPIHHRLWVLKAHDRKSQASN
nr:hypothetical protein [Tanacetum cinerariifolium]